MPRKLTMEQKAELAYIRQHYRCSQESPHDQLIATTMGIVGHHGNFRDGTIDAYDLGHNLNTPHTLELAGKLLPYTKHTWDGNIVGQEEPGPPQCHAYDWKIVPIKPEGTLVLRTTYPAEGNILHCFRVYAIDSQHAAMKAETYHEAFMDAYRGQLTAGL